jgi:protein-L-isoaspartate(D-aspartate) O-methyltransferase
MAAMLESWEVHEGNRVLEIGTGTGYNAALLSERLGDNQVVSIDIDPTLTRRAIRCLTSAGYHPTVATSDGINARAPGAPFDRLIATVAVSTLPPVWLNQIQPGGRILANLHSDLSGGALIRLTVNSDGSACGRFDPTPALFMPTRAQPPTNSATLLKAALRDMAPATTGRHQLDPGILNNQEFLFFAALLLPDVSCMGFAPTDGESQEWLLARDGSWAYCTISGITRQAGNRTLWNELEAIANQWQQLGQPARHRFGLTITTNTTHQLWLDHPETPHTWTLTKNPHSDTDHDEKRR